MMVTGALSRAAWLNVILGYPWPVEKNDNLVILHTAGFCLAFSHSCFILISKILTGGSKDVEAVA